MGLCIIKCKNCGLHKMVYSPGIQYCSTKCAQEFLGA